MEAFPIGLDICPCCRILNSRNFIRICLKAGDWIQNRDYPEIGFKIANLQLTANAGMLSGSEQLLGVEDEFAPKVDQVQAVILRSFQIL